MARAGSVCARTTAPISARRRRSPNGYDFALAQDQLGTQLNTASGRVSKVCVDGPSRGTARHLPLGG
jgi:hypothetical protein